MVKKSDTPRYRASSPASASASVAAERLPYGDAIRSGAKAPRQLDRALIRTAADEAVDGGG